MPALSVVSDPTLQAGTPATGAQLWFLDTRVTIRVPASAGPDGLSVLDHQAPHADSPPLHVHHTEDECFIVLEGNFRFHIADREHHATPGDVILVPRDVPHTYRVESPAGARWLTITTHGDFERFVRAIGRPPDRAGLPDPAAPPTPQALEHLAAAALRHGIELVGPPLR